MGLFSNLWNRGADDLIFGCKSWMKANEGIKAFRGVPKNFQGEGGSQGKGNVLSRVPRVPRLQASQVMVRV